MAEPDKRQIGDGSDNYGEAAKQMAKAAKEAGKETAKQAAVKGAEAGANADKMRIARNAKEQGLDAIHDTVHEMAKDEARHGRGFAGLFERYFGNKK